MSHIITFTKPFKVNLSPHCVNKAKRFAHSVTPTTNYGDSNQNNEKKIRYDHFISKIGEEAVVKVFKYLKAEVAGPDYAIYSRRKKSWAADLFVNSVALAVKTQAKSQANRFGLSWTFQAGQRRSDPILQQPNAWVCFVYCNNTLPTYPCIVLPPKQINTLVFGKPQLKRLQHKKKVVYANDNWPSLQQKVVTKH